MNTLYQLFNATGITLGLALCSLILGLILAMLFVGWESSRFKVLAVVGSLFVATVRGLPEILVVLFIYNGSSELLNALLDGFVVDLYFVQIPVQCEYLPAELSPFTCGVIALSLLYAAYASQTLRGAIAAVPKGQWEAGHALGLSKLNIFLRLILPQMWRHALPGLSNQWLVLLKDTALVSLVSVHDIMYQAKTIITRTQEPFTWYLVAAMIYLLITLVSQFIINRISVRASRFERGLA